MKTRETRPESVLFLGLLFSLCLGFLLLGSDAMGRPTDAVGAPSPSMEEIRHPVGAGEDLHLLAAYYYGDARQWKRIYQTNRGQIKNPSRIYPTQILCIEVPIGWKPPMPFSAWMDQVRGTAPPKEPSLSSSSEERPSAEPTGEGRTSGSR